MMRYPHRHIVFLCLLLAIGLVPGCRKKAPDESKPAAPASPADTANGTVTDHDPPEAAPDVAAEPPPPSRRLDLDIHQDLLQDAALAEVFAGGQWIDIGGPTGDLHTLGQWLSGWGPIAADDNVTWAPVTGERAWLTVAAQQAPSHVVARVRGNCPDQTVALALADQAPGQAVAVAESWSIVTLQPVADATGATHLTLVPMGGTCGSDTKAQLDVDWLFVAAAPDTMPPQDLVVGAAQSTGVSAPTNLGDKVRRALPAATSRAWTYHLHVPAAAEFVADIGASMSGVTFTLTARVDGQPPQTLLSEEAPANAWREHAVPLSTLEGSVAALELRIDAPPDASPDLVAGWGEPAILVARPAPATVGTYDGYDANSTAQNVVFVVIDTARADAFVPYDDDVAVQTPAYDKLAETGAVFTHSWNNTNWTKPSVASMLSGLYPFVHGAQSKRDKLPSEVKLLSEHLQKQGFATGGFVSNGFISSAFNFERGWDRFTNYPREELQGNAKNVYEDAWTWIKDRPEGERFFAYVQTSDPHVPYWVGKRWTRLYYEGSYKGQIGDSLDGYKQEELSGNHETVSEDDYAWIHALYYGEITYHDYHMGVFMDRLRSRGMLDNTLVIVTNDHGEEVDDHGQMGHEHSLYDELVRSPLLVHYPPRIQGGARSEVIVESIDIPATILELLGLDGAPVHQGLSLLPLLVPGGGPVPGAWRVATAIATFKQDKRAIRIGRYKLLRSNTADWAMLFDIAADPNEMADIAATSPVVRRWAEVHLAEAHARPRKLDRLQGIKTATKAFEARPVEIDPELNKQLEALGYFGE